MSDKPKLHGLSLSLCIRDILEGKVCESQVVRITAGTCARTPEDWGTLVAGYCKTYWRKEPGRASLILGRLLEAGRIAQPRLFGEEPPSSYHGIWDEVPFFEVGKTYRTLGGDLVTIIAESTTRGYETVQGDDCGPDLKSGWRYNRLGDLGRPTGSLADSPRALVPGAVD